MRTLCCATDETRTDEKNYFIIRALLSLNVEQPGAWWRAGSL